MKNVFIKGQENSLWNFYVDDKKRLCYETKKGKREILLEACSEEFDVCGSEDGSIHIAYQDEIGSVNYIVYSDGTWKKYCLLKSRSQNKNMRAFRLFYINGQLELFYILLHQFKFMLVHQSIHIQNFAAPDVIGYIENDSYFVCADSQSRLHIVFKAPEGGVQYRIYDSKQRRYQEQMLEISGDIRALCGACAPDGTLHIAYVEQAKSNAHYTLCHHAQNGKQKKTVGFGSDPNVRPFLFFQDNTLHILWQERYDTYEAISKNMGEKFSTARPIGRNIVLCACKFQASPEKLHYMRASEF